MEIFKEIDGYEGNYLISNYSNVYSIKKGKLKIMKPFKAARGYIIIDLSINGNRKSHYLHRLMALHFIENPNNYPDVNHIDHDKTNNNLSNLEWVNTRENVSHDIIKKNNSDKLLGASWYPPYNKYRSRIRIENKNIHLGYFNTKEEAQQAYINKLKEYNLSNKYATLQHHQ